MPTYEYKCSACGHAFEKFQSIMAGPVRKCPECGKNRVKRLISTGAGLIFKGSGFYITDYRSEAYKTASKSDSATAPKTDAKIDSKPAETVTKSESKAETKTESKTATDAAKKK